MISSGFVMRPDGTRIAYTSQGVQGAPAIVLSNSLATDQAMWVAVLPALTQSYRVISYDTRGHGKSSSATDTATLQDLAGDMLAVMDATQVSRACVVGVSLGGMTGLTLALQHPARVFGLMACNCRDQMDEGLNAGWAQRLDAVREKGVAALVEPTIERWFSPEFRSAEPTLMGEVRAMIARTSDVGYAACVHAIQALKMHDELPRITIPVLYVAGAQDGAAPATVMQGMASNTPGSRCEVIDPCGHITPMQRPEVFGPLILQFCAATIAAQGANT
jgi:3-oxoadipate enol-lactonase